MRVSLAEIAQLVNGEIVGNEQQIITSISPIDHIEKGSLVYAEGEANLSRAVNSEAGALLVDNNIENNEKPLIKVGHPLKAFITLLHHFNPHDRTMEGIHPTAVIAEDAVVGKHVYIGPYVVIQPGAVIGDHCILKSHIHIGRNVTLGKDTVIHPQVTVYDRCKIGSRVQIHSSTVIGSDGFGYTYVDGKHMKIPHIGHVEIEDDVEIGSNTAVDRATVGATVIGKGTKIDNLVQIAHSVKLGENNILCAFTGIAGSTTSGSQVTFAANVGVSDHVRIDNNVILGARTGVAPQKHLKEGTVYLGSPARPKDKAIELELSLTRIPMIRKNINRLKETVDSLSKRLQELEEKQ